MTRNELVRLGVSLAAAFVFGAIATACWVLERESRPHGHPFDRHLTDGTIAGR